MAQVKFYAKKDLPTENIDENGVYFIQGGELYKGSQRFGLGRVTVDAAFNPSTSSKDGQAKGDIVVTGSGAGWVFDGKKWQSIGGDITSLQSMWQGDIKTWTAGLVSTAQGDGTYIKRITQDDDDGKVKAEVSTFATDVQNAVGNGAVSSSSNGVIVSVATTSGVVTSVEVTAPAEKTWTAVDVGDANSYIYNVKQGTNGQVSASAAAFPTLASGDAAGQVKLGSTNATVNGWADLVSDVEANTTSIAGLSTTIANVSARVTGIESIVDVSNSAISASSGTFTNLSVNTATFSATTVSASSLTINGSTVEQLADKQIAAIAATTKSGSDSAAGITVGVTTQSGAVTTVTVDGPEIATSIAASGTASDSKVASEKAVRDAISSLDNAMHFNGVVKSLPASAESGDIVVIGANPTGEGLVEGQEYIYDGTKWEKIGDQSAVTGGSSTSSVNNVSVQVVTAAATAAPTVTLTGIGTAAAKDIADTVTADATTLPTCSAVASYVATKLSYTPSETVTTGATTLDGAVHAVASAFDTLKDKTDAYVGGNASSTASGITASVTIASTTMAPTVSLAVDASALATVLSLGTAASKDFADSLTATGTGLPTESAVAGYVSAEIAKLDASVSTSTSDNVSVTITQEDGVVTAVTATLNWITD